MSKKMLKDSAINVRLTTEQKKRLRRQGYVILSCRNVLYVLQNKRVTVIKNGSEIALMIFTILTIRWINV